MSTEFMELVPGKHRIIKVVPDYVVPWMEEGASVTIDGKIFRVKSYLLIVEGDDVRAQIRIL